MIKYIYENIYNQYNMNIAIFGGSFDPLHDGHIDIVKKSLQKLNIKKLIIMPTYLSAFKSSFNINPDIRYKMLKRVFYKYKKVCISSYEQDLQQVVYSYDSILYLQKKFHTTNIYLIIGADNFKKLPKWYNFKKLNKKVIFVIAKRDNIRLSQKIKHITLQCHNKSSSTNIKETNNIKHIPKQARIVLDNIQKGLKW
jgi:nicotinate-nucleotide adenylyltransferase